MDLDTLDATQAIYHDDFDDETDEDLTGSQRKPVGFLRVQEQKGVENKEYPVFEGDNIIGRHESCQICIPSKSLSKEHACITVKSSSHLIYDKGSRNKTKRGKLFLSPDVRYELKHKDELVFADVCCTYAVADQTKAGADSGSETDNEEMEVPEDAAATSKSFGNNRSPSKSGAMFQQNEEEDYASDGSSDILQPTQPCDASANSTVGLQKAGLRNEEEKTIESNLSWVMETPEFLKKPLDGLRNEGEKNVESNLSSVMETPEFLKKPLDVTATLVLPESGSETDDEGMSNIPPETLVFHDDDDKTENESAMLGAATQALGDKPGNADETQLYGASDDEDRWSGSDTDMMEAATQAMPRKASPSPVGKGHASRETLPEAGSGKAGEAAGAADAGIHVVETQAYDMVIDLDGSSKDSQDKEDKDEEKGTADDKATEVSKDKNEKWSQKVALAAMETQKMEDVTDEDENGNESEGAVSPRKLAITTMETQKMEDITDDEDKDEDVDSKQVVKAAKGKALTMMETQKMDDAAEPNAEEDGDENSSQLTGLFEMSTLACEVSEGESDDDGKDAEKGVSFEDATQAIETVPFGDERIVPLRGKATKQTAPANGDATAPVDDPTMPIDTKADDATVPIESNADGATMKVDATAPVDDPTMPIKTKADDATVPIESNTEGATMKVDATAPVDDPTMPIDTKADDATMPVESNADGAIVKVDATIPIESKANGGTVPVDSKANDATIPIDEKAEDATVPVETKADDATVPVDREEGDTVAVSDTVAISDTVPVSDTVAISATAAATGSDVKKSSASAADTLPMAATEDDATQEFDGIVRSEEDDVATLPVCDDTSDEEAAASKSEEGRSADVGDHVPMEEDASLPLFLPQITRGSDVSEEEDTPEMVPESQHDEESTAIIKVPEKSPLKSALVDHTTRSKSPSPKRVAFAEPDISDEEPPPPKMARGRRRARFKAEPTRAQAVTSSQRKGKGRGAKIAKSTRTSQAETCPDIPDQEIHEKDQSKTLAENSSTADEAEIAGENLELSPVVSLQKTQPAGADEVKATPPSSEKTDQHSESEPRRSGRARKPKKFADDSEEGKKVSTSKDSMTSDSLTPHTEKRDSRGKGKSMVVATEPETKDAEESENLISETENKDDAASVPQAASERAAEVDSEQPEPNLAGQGTASVGQPSTETKGSPPEKEEISSARADDEATSKQADSSRSATRTRRGAKKFHPPETEDSEKSESEKMETESLGDSKMDSKMEVEESPKDSSKPSKVTALGKKRTRKADTEEEETAAKKARLSAKNVTESVSAKKLTEELSAKNVTESISAKKLTEELSAKKVTEDTTAEPKKPALKPEDKMEGDEDADTKAESGKGTSAGRRGSKTGSTKSATEDEKGQVVEAHPSRQSRSSARGKTDPQDINTDEEASAPSPSRLTRGRGKADKVADDKPEENVITGSSSRSRGSMRSSGKAAEEDVGEADRSYQATISASKKGKEADEEMPDVKTAHDVTAVTQEDDSSPSVRGRGRFRRKAQVEASHPDPEVTQKGSTAKTQSMSRQSQDVPAEDSPSAEGKKQPDDTAPPKAASSSGRRPRVTRGNLHDVVKQTQDTAITDLGQKLIETQQSKESDAKLDTSASRSSRRKGGKQVVEEKPEEPTEASQNTATTRRGRQNKKAPNAERDESADKESEEADEIFKARRGRTAKKAQEEEKEDATEPEPSTKHGQQTRKAGSFEEDACTEPQATEDSKNTATDRRGGPVKIAKNAQPNQATESGPSLKPARHGRKALRFEKDASADQQPEDSSQNSSVTKRGRQAKKNQRDDSLDQKSEDGSQTPMPTQRGRQAKKTQSSERGESTDRQFEASTQSHSQGSQDSSPTRVGRKGRKSQSAGSEAATEASMQSHSQGSQDSTPTSVGRRGRKSQSPGSEAATEASMQSHSQGSQDSTPTSVGRRGRKSQSAGSEAATEASTQSHSQGSLDSTPTSVGRRGRKSQSAGSEAATEASMQSHSQGSQDSTPTSVGRRGRKSQSAGNEAATEASMQSHSQGSQDSTPTSVGRRGRKSQRAGSEEATEASTQSHSQGSQDSTPTSVGRRGRKSQSAGNEAATEQSVKPGSGDATDREPTRRGTKRAAAVTEHGRGDVAHPETAESSEGPTPQKRGRKTKESVKDVVAEEKISSTPVPGKRSRQSGGSETPTRSEGKADKGAVHSPSLRRTTLSAKPKIIFTGVIHEHGEKIVKELGGEIAQSVQECTYLVTDKIRRTVKFLGGVARGVTIITPQWLESCKSSGMFVDSSKFMVNDSAVEKQYKFSLKSSLQKAAKSPLLDGYRVHVTKSVRPEPQQMKEILQCAGAEWLATMPKKAADKVVVISCEEDKSVCQTAVAKGIDIVSAEFVLTGVLRQEVDINGFRLFASVPGPSSSRRRR